MKDNMAEKVKEKQGISKSDKSFPCLLVSPRSWVTEPMKAFQLLASPPAIPSCPPVASSSAVLSRAITHLLFSFSLSAQHMSPYSLFWRLYSPWEGWTCSEVTSRKHLLWELEMAPTTRKLCCYGSSCLLLLTLAGLQTFLPFAKSSLFHHGAMTNGNKSQF